MPPNRLAITRLVAVLVAALAFMASALWPINVSAYNTPSYSDVANAYYQGLGYIRNLVRYVYDPTTWTVKYKVIAEYPSLPVWGKLNGFVWVPAFGTTQSCAGSSVTASTYVHITLSSEKLYSDRSVWVFDYVFKYVVGLSYEGAVTYDLAHLRVAEEQRSDGYYTISVSVISYGSAPAFYDCPAMDGSQLKVYVGGVYVGTVGNLAASPWQSTYSLPRPSFRFSLRHVEVLGDLFFQAIGSKDDYLHNFVMDALYAVFEQTATHLDLYGNALFEYPVIMNFEDVVEIQFYDAHWFDADYGRRELGYYRLLDWMTANGYTDATNRGVFYPLYPYKSRVVAAAEATGLNGGTLFINAISEGAKNLCGDEDPMYNAWKGLYYAASGQWGQALAQWYDVVDNWDGTGIKACYSSGYSIVRLALAVMLGTLLAKRGYIDWSIVDDMVNMLLKTQWKGSGYYKPEGGDWVYIYKNDHKGGFMTSYAVAPDGSLGFAPFRPGWTGIITQGTAMDPEYIGPTPTNAETTLAALVALKLYMDSRY